MDRAGWPVQREQLTSLFKSKTRAEWDATLRGSDACYAPVLTMSEAMHDEHLRARGTIVEMDGVAQPAPAPRFSRTPGEIQRPAPWPGQHTDDALADWGIAESDIAALKDSGAIA
jgi:alpha-methylacyl-CoA racemase